MYCKNCGNEYNPNDYACLSCGCDPKKGNKHCGKCGTTLNPDQILCVNCGTNLVSQPTVDTQDKTVAIVAYITLIGFIIAIVQHSSKKTQLGAYHLRQVVGLMFTSLAFWILLSIITIPIMAMAYSNGTIGLLAFIGLISLVGWVGLFVCYIISLVNAINGKEKPAPIFGKYYEKLFKSWFN